MKNLNPSTAEVFFASGGQINIAKDSSTINAVQNNGMGKDELEEIVKDIIGYKYVVQEHEIKMSMEELPFD